MVQLVRMYVFRTRRTIHQLSINAERQQFNFLSNVILHLRPNKNLEHVIVYKDWIDVAQDRDQWRVLVHSNEPSGSVQCWEVLE
jgi:hypothetical protein